MYLNYSRYIQYISLHMYIYIIIYTEYSRKLRDLIMPRNTGNNFLQVIFLKENFAGVILFYLYFSIYLLSPDQKFWNDSSWPLSASWWPN